MPLTRGAWLENGLPFYVRIGGAWYERSGGLSRPGVIAHYREVTARDSRHLYVRDDGTWYIDHVDTVNPNGGLLDFIRHLVLDVLGR